MKKSIIILIMALPFFMWQCTDVKDWHDATDNVAPGILSNVTVKNINGGAWIYYTLPVGDNDLLGVKAVWSFVDGKESEAFASAFNDSILVEGAPDTQERTVKLYVLDKSRNESVAVEKVIQPLTPPVELIRESLKVNPTFGGLYVQWENTLGNDIAVSLYVRDSIGDFISYDVTYTKTSGRVIFNGFEPEERVFRLEIRDKWNNYSLPLDMTLTPLTEVKIVGREGNNNIWSHYGYVGDDRSGSFRGEPYFNEPGGVNQSFEAMFDGIYWSNASYWGTMVLTLADFIPGGPSGNLFPMYFTIDMGRLASYSRIKYWLRGRSPAFSAPAFIDFEIWGSNSPKPLAEIGDGSKMDNLKYWTSWSYVGGTDAWKNDWQKLADCELKFPSGTLNTVASVTGEDATFLQNGVDFFMLPEMTSVPFRYVRFVVKRTNTNSSQINLGELEFYGAYAN
jgi:hypothetical protein